jgi:hypothetical protein
MRSQAKSALLVLLLSVTVAPAALAQESRASSNNVSHRRARVTTRVNPDQPQKQIASRPLALGEGLAILGAALDSRHHHADFSSDCSHLVHGLYERAGFPYEYARSSDLYAGTDEFRRVSSAQPGDLAVWRGHVGIVINPAQHSFFSTLRSGPGVDSYDSPYWKQRGRPRFFRYVKPAPNRVLSSSTRTASLKPAALGNTEPREEVAENVVEDNVPDGSEEPLREAGSSAKFGEKQLISTTTPRVIVINSVRPKPDQVAAAFLEACKSGEESLDGRDLFNPAHSLIIFDHFEVKKMHLKGDQGWVEVLIDEPVSLTGSAAQVHKHSERQRWPLLRRDNASWELKPSPDAIYLPRPVAAHVMAHELSKLTEDGPDTAGRTLEKAELARLLAVLLSK